MRGFASLIIVLSGALAGSAGALEPGQTLRDGRGSSGVPVFVTPEGPVVVSRAVWQAVLDRYPEISDGPERAGMYVVGIIVKNDGSVAESVMGYAATPAGLREASLPVVELIPRDMPMATISPVPAGSVVTTLQGERRLKAAVRIRHRMMPREWDAERSGERVERLVRQQRPEHFLPRGANRLNLLTVYLEDGGLIAREELESLQPDSQQVAERMGATQPGDFSGLGMEAARIGITGAVLAVRPAASIEDPGLYPLGADGIPVQAFGTGAPGATQLLIRYAWQRRPGEPIGGESSSGLAAPGMAFRPPTPGLSGMVMVERPPHPSEIPGEGAPWALMSAQGKLLRTGRIVLPEGEPLSRDHLERLMPGIRIRFSSTISFSGRPGSAQDAYATLMSFVLAPDSPAPPDQDAR